MTRKKATMIIEGNQHEVERVIHQLAKLNQEANRQPELTTSLQTEALPANQYDPNFEQPNQD